MGKRKFPLRLFNLLNNDKYNSVITWSEDGKKIIIKNKAKLVKLLQTEFKSESKSGSESESKSESKSCSQSESDSGFTSESKPETKSESISESKKKYISFESVIRQLNKYGFSKDNSKEDIYSLENFEKDQKETFIENIKPKDIKKLLAEIKENKNNEEKIDFYIEELNNSKNKINPNLLKDILEFLVERHEQRKKISKDIQELKQFYGKLNPMNHSE